MTEVTAPLTFRALHEKIETSLIPVSRGATSRVEKWSLRIGIGAMILGLLLAQFGRGWVPGVVLVVLLVTCFVAEVVCFVLVLVIQLRRDLPGLIHAKANHARSMDREFKIVAEISAWLSTFPHEQRAARRRFVHTLKDSMSSRLGMLVGGMDKLGVLPLLLALYLQLKDWTPGDWSAAFNVGVVPALIIFFIVMLYGVAWMSVSLRGRLELVESLLDESLAEDARLPTRDEKSPRRHGLPPPPRGDGTTGNGGLEPAIHSGAKDLP